MRFLLDENFPKAAVAFIESHGHQATRIASGSGRSLADEQVFEAAQEQAAILLTTDRDFYHTVPWKYARHHGVVVVALRRPNRANIIGKLSWLLETLPPNAFVNRVIHMRDTTWLSKPPMSG